MADALVQIRNVPDQTRRVLKARAAARGESLNTYLLRLLEREVGQPTAEEVFARAARRSWRLSESSVELVRQMREEHEREVGE